MILRPGGPPDHLPPEPDVLDPHAALRRRRSRPMSRRSHHPARGHARPAHAEPRPTQAESRSPRAAAAPDRTASVPDVRDTRAASGAIEAPRHSPPAAPPGSDHLGGGDRPASRAAAAPAPDLMPPPQPMPAHESAPRLAPPPDAPALADVPEPPASDVETAAPDVAAAVPEGSRPPLPGFNGGEADRSTCTAPQLRRFIKSRAYVPMHELRRRFAIEGGDDDVTPVEMPASVRIYVGLPHREGRLLGELFRNGEIGYELSMDPITPIVVGVFPMRPVPRA